MHSPSKKDAENICAVFYGCLLVYVITPFGVVLLIYPPAIYPRARAPEEGGRINRNTTTKGVIKCLLQVARWFGVISWQRSRKRAFSRAPSVYWSVHFRAS